MTDLEIAKKHSLKPIQEIAQKLGVDPEEIEMYGKYKAKLPLHLIDEKKLERSNLILVTAISPTPAGEGKTTMSIGLSEALNRLGKKTTVVLREPSLGPVFGIKGGATGGGYSQVIPMEDINLHFTGDFSAIEKAHNLLAAIIDNNIQSKSNSLGIDGRTVVWKRVVDLNDRSLRKVLIGLGGTASGVPRETGFDITAASEIMAILCLSSGLEDLKRRLGNIFIGYTFEGQPIYARDLKAEGAMTVLLKDAIKPNLVQTLEGNPAIIHAGPFANIAQGTNTVLATKMGMTFSEFTVTEAGFGFDLGGEKFFNIKCQSSGLKPKAVVLTATIRAIKYHGGVDLKNLTESNVKAVKKGLENLQKHVENIQKFKIRPIIAINKFISDTDEEIKIIEEYAQENDIQVAVADIWEKGGEGGLDLARKLIQSVESEPSVFKPLYDWNSPLTEKIKTIAREIYGAKYVDYSVKSKAQLKRIEKLGLEGLPICMAKTQKSFSGDPNLLGRPENFSITIREIEIAAGAGFLVPIVGDMMRMPGLPAHPASEGIDIDENGEVIGLF
ncbi:formate--tetrahydrofolate ligase [Algoriphagus sediminis]|uniref:Formate--tetrahydrofolate ligase n=1 Tax=Algoriphagus sediminis TaxID=3057113 RepID=A0ABT7YD98_9BACT|nr:formate--tetrahydrofolate ligase [Algoriphagus sediminis]MDN3204431.1 formate--tetrahydrofolate ligase [Algoriphagus sediminis]